MAAAAAVVVVEKNSISFVESGLIWVQRRFFSGVESSKAQIHFLLSQDVAVY